jgi:DnaK suppressor protein
MPTDFNNLRNSIIKRRSEVATQLRRLKGEAQTGGIRHADAYDQAAHSYDVHVLNEQRERAQRELRLLDVALSRIESGSYGSCILCGGEIPTARLKAIPWARYCMECQQQQERAS